jgi:acyl-CoA thioesterase FadM
MFPSWIPPEPPHPPEHRGSRNLYLRYEDVSQDGRLVVEGLPHALGAVWRQLAQERPVRFGEGVVSILSRVVLEGGEGPISVNGGAEAEGFFHLAHTVSSDGAPDRIILAMWADVKAPLGRTHPPRPADAGRPLVAGRLFAEHVFTRPFAPHAERRVRAIALGDGTPFVPEARYTWRDPEAILALPEGAVALDPVPVLDEAPTVFGFDHTDSNQHVNSLVYPRLFIEAALRRFHALGLPCAVLARGIEIAYRKPCFAGDRARVTAQAFALGERRGVTATISAEGDGPGARPRCVARLVFEG